MSYQVIARKWRPQSFDEVSAQSHVTTPLRNAIATGRVPHAVLLTGPRGVGKTTVARILARCLNCESGPTETPCGTCTACREISDGRSTDVQEVDAASRTSVDDVRGLIEAVRYAPTPGKHRIYVIDEVHMLSTAAFNALLKTLEEPPPSSLFVFATTNPEKIPFTVLSRCQRYDLRRISTKEIASRLRTIAEADGITISEPSLLAIAREGDGSMRDAQTLLDQVIAYGGADVRDEVVAGVLDLIDRRLLLDILEACVDANPAGALEACARASSGGSDAKRLSEVLIGLLRDLVVLRVAPEAEGLVEGSEDEIAELRALAERTEEARLRRMFRALVKEQEDLAWAPDPLAVLEMGLVRLATMPAGDDVSRLLARLEALERSLAGGSAPGGTTPGEGGRNGGGGGGARPRPTRGGGAGAAGRASASSASGTGPTPPSTPISKVRARTETGTSADAAPAPAARAPDPAPAPEPLRAAPEAPGIGAPLDIVFDRLRGRVREENPALFACLEGMRLTARVPGQLTLAAPSAFNKKRLEDRADALEDVCTRFFGERTRLVFEEPEQARRPSTAPRREDERRLRQEALNHPIVNTALKVLEADIVEIRPLGGGSPSGGRP